MKKLFAIFLAFLSLNVFSQDTTKLRTIFYDNFGRIDLSDSSGNTFKVWDYSNNKNPKEITVEALSPFRLPLPVAPRGCTFGGSGAVVDGQYCVSAYMTSFAPYKGIKGAMLQWAANTTGQSTIPPIAFDHTKEPEGACLLINSPMNSKNEVIYDRNFSNLDLCPNVVNKVIFESFITVFTNSTNGIDISLRLNGGVNESSFRHVVKAGESGWLKISDTIEVYGKTILMEIINNLPSSIDGGDLAIDDIKILTEETEVCEPLATISSESEKLVVYPTITSDLLFLSDKATRMQIYNSVGEVVMTSSLKEVSLKALQNGVYCTIIELTSGEILPIKIVKE